MIKYIRNLLRGSLEYLLYGSKRSSQTYIRFLRKQGVSIGQGTVFYEPLSNVVDTTTPHILSIGDNVRITRGVVILTHDYSWSVLAGVYGECLGGIAPVTIRDNVFIGMDAHILKGVTIGNNVIIGAGSVVTSDCESNSVYAGNPARKIMTLEEFYYKKKKRSSLEAEEVAKRIKYLPTQQQKRILSEYSYLFCKPDDPDMRRQINATGYAEKCNSYYQNNGPLYESFEKYLDRMKDLFSENKVL